MTTKLLYMENMDALECDATIVSITIENEKDVIVLNQTVFYPQGGGQPYDKGTITKGSDVFQVEEVRFIDGIVKHIGKFQSNKFTANDQVHCKVDAARRNINCRIHSAGHVIDMAVSQAGLSWTPAKGYHFSDGPYVEYIGSVLEEQKEQVRITIENNANKLLAENHQTTLKFMDKESMKAVCRFIPDNFPSGKPLRVVLFGQSGIPCGGTHVNNLSAIGKITIKKIKAAGPNTRVSYEVS